MREKSLLILILKGEINIDDLVSEKHFKEKGIIIAGHYFNYNKKIEMKDAISQVKLIVEIHKLLIGCKFNGLNRINSKIGKEVEDFKVQIKKLEKDYTNIIEAYSQNSVDKLIICNGKRMLEQGKEAINYIYKHDYIGIIERSMNRDELCIEKVDQSNLRITQEGIEIGTIKGISYNLVEEDLYNYIKKLQGRHVEINQEELIKTFVYSSHLSFNSFDYLKGLCSYPRDFLKTWEKYRSSKKAKTDDEYFLLLKKSMEYEEKSFML